MPNLYWHDFCLLFSSSDTKSILRCFSHQASDQLAFIIGQSSPSADNLCPLPPVIINEVNVVSMGEDVGEYVELSSGGVPYFPLNNLYLVSLLNNDANHPGIIKHS